MVTSRNVGAGRRADLAFAARTVASATRTVAIDPALLAQTISYSRKRAPSSIGTELIAPITSAATAAGVKRQITFSGCGGLYTYLFGVAAYMQQNFAWDHASTCFASASAGCYPAFLLAANVDVEAYHYKANQRFLRESETLAPLDARAIGLGRWNDFLKRNFKQSVLDYAGADAHLKLRHKHYISLTRVPTLANVLVADYDSLDDLVDGYIASGYLPIYDETGRLACRWRDELYIDGGLSDNAPLPFGDEVPSLVLSLSKWRDHEELASGFPVPFVRANWEYCDDKFRLGKQDAASSHAELAAWFDETA